MRTVSPASFHHPEYIRENLRDGGFCPERPGSLAATLPLTTQVAGQSLIPEIERICRHSWPGNIYPPLCRNLPLCVAEARRC